MATVGMHITYSVTRLRDYWTLGNFLKSLAAINLPKSLTFLGNFCKGVNIFHSSSEIIFGQLLWTFGDFFLVTLITYHISMIADYLNSLS